MWTSQHIILFCIHRNLPFGRFLRRITQIQTQFGAFLCSFALQKSLLEYPNPSSSTSQPHIHTQTDTHAFQTHTKKKRWGRATPRLYYLRRLMMKDEKQSECEMKQEQVTWVASTLGRRLHGNGLIQNQQETE